MMVCPSSAAASSSSLIMMVLIINIVVVFVSFCQMNFGKDVVVMAQSPPVKPIISFCAGYYMSCAVFDNKRMKCFGYGGYTGLGDSYGHIGISMSDIGDNLAYTNVGSSGPTPLGIVKVTCGVDHICVKLETNQVKCMGYNNFGQCGIGTTNNNIDLVHGYTGDALPFVNLGTGIEALDIVSGYWHNCVIITGNLVKCYGSNSFGQLGYGDTTDRGTSSSQMGDSLGVVNLGANAEVLGIYSGTAADHFCAILSQPAQSAQRFKCWGNNNNYQLGYGDANRRGDDASDMGDNLQLVDLGTESKVKIISLGGDFTCALLMTDNIKCWGRGEDGRLGLGSTSNVASMGNSLPFVTLDSNISVKLLITGLHHTCIVYDDYITMKCFGRNIKGQLGQGDKVTRGDTLSNLIPTIPAIQLGTGSLTISSISTGGDTNCVIFNDYSVKCFGDNFSGMCGVGHRNNTGDDATEMGSNLQYAMFFSPTTSPTVVPTTESPSSSPVTNNPTTSPIKSSTLSPTRRPTKKPTQRPTKSPVPTVSNSPSTSPTTSNSPTLSPSTSPSKSPTIAGVTRIDAYDPKKTDCYTLKDINTCTKEENGHCGPCVFYSNKAWYGFRLSVYFTMENGIRFSEFDSTIPLRTTMKDGIKAIISAALNGEERLYVERYGQIYQPISSNQGSVVYDINFIDSVTNKEAAKNYFLSNPDLTDYVYDMNYYLNKKMGTKGKVYITGRCKVYNLSIIDKDSGKGACGCPDIASSSLSSNVSFYSKLLFSFITLFLIYFQS